MKVRITTHGIPRLPGGVSDDALRVEEQNDIVIAALGDGLGTAKEAAIASQRAVDLMVDYYLARPQAWSPLRALNEFATQINRLLFQESQQRHGKSELLTTLSVLALDGEKAYGFNVGDSPVYHWHESQLRRISESHSFTEPGMEHVLTRAVGLTDVIDPFFFEVPIADGDLLLICSDGVSGALSEEQIRKMLERRASARTLVSAAREFANEHPEFKDDASAIVVEIVLRGWRGDTLRRSVEVLDSLRVDQEIDGFRLLKALQEGDRVWLAEQKADRSRRVLKFPALDSRDDETRRDAFVKEAWQASRIVSPDFVLTTIPDHGSFRYYQMEYIEAPTLREDLKIAALKVEETIALGKFLLRTGQFLLSRDVVHGDIKPENILVLRSASETVFKLLDLGSVAELFSVTSRAGTSSYLAPERFRQAAVAERTEIFSIGVTLYEALARSYPYGEIERFQTPRFDHLPKDLTRVNATVPPWLNSVIQRALAPDPERRYQNFSEMAFELEHPDQVVAYYRKDRTWIERNPLTFYKILSVLLGSLCVYLLFRLSQR